MNKFYLIMKRKKEIPKTQLLILEEIMTVLKKNIMKVKNIQRKSK